MAEQLKELTSKRKTIKGACTRLQKHLDQITDENVNLLELNERKAKFEQHWVDFNDIQAKIEELDPTQESEREPFENTYYSLTAKMSRIMIQYSAGSNNSTYQQLHTQLKLPRINLPTFDGSYEDWYPFYDTFKAMIHASYSISKIQKFHYLKSSLTGEAAQAIHSLEITADNYDNAWEILKTRYDNKRIIIQNHIKSIFDLPTVHKENHTTLRQVLDGVLKHLRALKSLKRSVDSWDDLVMHIIITKLDSSTIREWETSLTTPEMPTLKEMTDFLTRKCQTLEAISTKPQQSSSAGPQQRQTQNKGTTSHLATNQATCPLCKGDHFIYHCNSFRNMSVENRTKEVKARQLCLNCLKTGSHSPSACWSGACRKCNKKHHTLLHRGEQQRTEEPPTGSSKSSPPTPEGQATATSVNHSSQAATPQILLATAIIEVYDRQGRTHQCRALLDSGSQSSFITEDLATRLQLSKRGVHVPVTGINNSLTHIHNSVEVRIKSRLNNFKMDMNCLVLKKITESLPTISFDPANLKIPITIKLADPEFYKSAEIDLLIGAEIFWDLLCVGQIRTTRNQPSLQKTHLGWIVSGQYNASRTALTSTCCHFSLNGSEDTTTTDIWRLEHDLQGTMNPDGRKCQRHFSETHKRTQQGRFIVQLPIIQEKVNQLGDSYEIALKRFIGLERKLSNQPELKKEYTNFIREYEALGHMNLVPSNEAQTTATPVYYLPHHAVIKESSTTTKLRVVFDGSSKTTTGVSLNDTMLAGPTIQDDLFSIIARFRTHQYAITADITKMYRQVLLDPSQTSLQRILWRDEPHEEIRTYELATVTYGTTSASYLAIRALIELAWLEEETYPLGSNAVMNDFYVDDLLTGANSIPEALRLRDETINVLKKGCFELAKWASNCLDLVPDSLRIDGNTKDLSLDKSENVRTLGIQWNFSSDTFQYVVPTISTSNHVTKRSILSSIAQIFDPLGLIGPVIVTARILIQALWQLKLDWDESVPLAVHSKWFQYQSQLPELNNLKIPRKILPIANPRNIQIHGFCDASQEAYGICIYIRAENDNGDYSTRLICSKSRVAPLKQTTIPRLELCGALLLAVQMNKLVEALKLPIDSIHYWTDSTIVLDWIKSQSRRWNVFVGNRVGEIQELSNPSAWKHISTADNPADIISRGSPPNELIQNDLWWHGPPWLATDSSHWPVSTYTPNYERVTEQRKIVAMPAINRDDLCFRYSSLNRLTRITAYCLRFICNSRKKKTDRITGRLTTAELNASTNRLVKNIQASSFASELKALTNGAELPRQSKLLSLNPFLDDQQIIRVGGRLQNSNLPYATKHPMVLPAHHPFTKLVIKAEHANQLHAGAQATLAAVRARFWPLTAKSLVKYVVRQCVTCFKAAPQGSQGIMGNLPQQRVELTRPFNNTGVDYFGPLYVREGQRRNSKTVKAYGAIFVCFATRAVHLELVSDMTSETFIHALKRFIGRRGKPANIFSDNGTNFVGGNNELNELRELFMDEQNQDYIVEHPSTAGITWHFIPPQAPNFGGIWEAAVKSAKHHLKRTAGESAALTFEEMQTLLIQIEAVLNSRPITPLSEDPNDLSYLTPGHFLIGDALTANPEPNLAHIQLNRLSRWQRIEQIKQHFWKRWSKECLNEYQQRLKWKTNAGPKLDVGQLVIIRDDNLPPLLWRMGRVEMVHPGNDDIIRAATLKTSKGSVKRPASKLCILPIE